MDSQQVPGPLSAKYKGTFAYDTVKERMPIILTKVIDRSYRLKEKVKQDHGQDGLEDLKTLTGRFSKLRNEMQTDKPILPIDDGAADNQLWNACLEREIKSATEDEPPSWFSSAWLYVECYMYRRINEALANSVFLRSYDPFRELKESGFMSAQEAILALTGYLCKVLDQIKGKDIGEYKHLFEQMIELCLWGNKFDLSISAGVQCSDEVNPLDQLDQFNPFILVNHTDQVLECLKTANQNKPGNVRVDIVLDNAGFEVISDLCFAEFLLDAGLVNEIVFHPKAMPWFVSDVVPHDLTWVLQTFLASNSIYMSKLGQKWSERFESGSLRSSEHLFWTSPLDYSQMKMYAPDLYNELAKSDLVYFKGDLNYRKLVADRMWDHTTSYEVALQGFHPAPVCSFRTLKADVVVGLEPGQDKATEEQDADWMISGKYGVIQFCGRRD